MNKPASESHHLPFHHKANVIEVYWNLPKKTRVETIRHEMAEAYLMGKKHYSYPKAHKLALKFEKMGVPFKPEVVRKLK
jgi:hypothetical protein